MWQTNELYVMKTKRHMFGAIPTQHHGVPLHIVKHGGGCIMLWVCLSSAMTRDMFRIKRYRQYPRGKPGSVCFSTDTGRQINLSAGQ